MAAITTGEPHNRDKVTCGNCGSEDLIFEGVTQLSQKGIRIGIPILFSPDYTKNTIRSIHRCKNCGRVTLYPVIET